MHILKNIKQKTCGLMSAGIVLTVLVACGDDHIDEYPMVKTLPVGHQNMATGDVAHSSPFPASADADLAPMNTLQRSELIQWTIPADWKSVAASGMRLASFELPGNGNLSVIRLGAGAGGVLDNVNRWRGQVGFDPVAGSEIASVTTRGQSLAGDFLLMTFVNPKNSETAICGAMYFSETFTLFVKLTGPPACVEKNAAAVYAYCTTAQLKEVE